MPAHSMYDTFCTHTKQGWPNTREGKGWGKLVLAYDLTLLGVHDSAQLT